MERRLAELRISPKQRKRERMTLLQALKSYEHPIEKETEEGVKRVKKEIDTLIKELSAVKDDSWLNYCPPDQVYPSC